MNKLPSEARRSRKCLEAPYKHRDIISLCLQDLRSTKISSVWYFWGSSEVLAPVRDDSANGQDFPFRSQLTVPDGVPFVPNEDENAKYKKSLFLY